MFPKKTREQFEAEMKAKHGNKYELVGRYGNMNSPTDFKNVETGEVFKKAPVDIMRGC